MRLLNADEIQVRVAQIKANGASLLLYKDARCDRKILTETYGDLWQNDFKVIDGKMYGGIGIYNKDLNQWLWRWDCGVESNTEAEKGQASDCFKRAGFKWGIGIELYSAPFIWVNIDTVKDGVKYKLANPFMKFNVKEIGYDENRNINKLKITDDKGNVLYELGKYIIPKSEPQVDPDIDIFEGMKACTDMVNLKIYYDEQRLHVHDKEGFAKLKDEMKGKFKKNEKYYN